MLSWHQNSWIIHLFCVLVHSEISETFMVFTLNFKAIVFIYRRALQPSFRLSLSSSFSPLIYLCYLCHTNSVSLPLALFYCTCFCRKCLEVYERLTAVILTNNVDFVRQSALESFQVLIHLTYFLLILCSTSGTLN